MIHPADADDLTRDLARLIEDAAEIEDWMCEVVQVAPRKIRMRFGRDRFELTVTMKR